MCAIHTDTTMAAVAPPADVSDADAPELGDEVAWECSKCDEPYDDEDDFECNTMPITIDGETFRACHGCIAGILETQKLMNVLPKACEWKLQIGGSKLDVTVSQMYFIPASVVNVQRGCILTLIYRDPTGRVVYQKSSLCPLLGQLRRECSVMAEDFLKDQKVVGERYYSVRPAAARVSPEDAVEQQLKECGHDLESQIASASPLIPELAKITAQFARKNFHGIDEKKALEVACRAETESLVEKLRKVTDATKKLKKEVADACNRLDTAVEDVQTASKAIHRDEDKEAKRDIDAFWQGIVASTADADPTKSQKVGAKRKQGHSESQMRSLAAAATKRAKTTVR